MWLDSLRPKESHMATKLKIIEDHARIVPAPTIPDFEPAPTRKRHAGWTVLRQRKFIERLARARTRVEARTWRTSAACSFLNGGPRTNARPNQERRADRRQCSRLMGLALLRAYA